MTDDEYLEVAASILDGTPVSWDTLPEPETAADRGFVKQLRLLDELTRAHHEAQSPLGTHWGPLLIAERIGSGTFGDVYKARDTALDRDVALKLLRSLTAGRHLAEGRLLARVRHPNIVTVHGAAEHDGFAGIWMEFIQGRTLAQLVAERGPFPPAAVAAIGIDVCRALAAVHASGLLHGDIKAQNVMREDGGRIVLMDFGTGRITGDTPPAAMLAGTPLYVAPEVLDGEPADAVSDIYSVGVLLYFLLTGAFPVEGRTLNEVRAAHLAGARTPIRERRPDVPRTLAAVVDRATAPAKRQRYQTATALEAAVAAATRRPLWRRPGAVAASLILGAAVAAGWWRFPVGGLATRRPPIAFQARDWVLVAQFENRTGDSLLDGTLEYGLEQELANSRFVNVVPRERIEDALRLMKRAPDTLVNAAVGREICLRDGAIRALVTGGVNKRGTRYVLTANLVDPVTGGLLGGATEDATNLDGILPAARRVSNRLRELLGEKLQSIRAADAQLDKVTTPSLRALQLYTRADSLVSQGNPRAAAILLEQALALDPDFASAQMLLAWALRNVQRPQQEYLPHAERAVRLAAAVTDHERYFILGSYYQMIGRPDEAISQYEALLRLYPDHYWGMNNLWHIYRAMHRPGEALTYVLRRAALRPNDLARNFEATRSLVETGDYPRARPYAERVLALRSQAVTIDDHQKVVWVRYLPALERWFKRDMAGARRAVDELVRSAGEEHGLARDETLYWAVYYYVALGKLAAARQAAQNVTGVADHRDLCLALVAFYAGDIPAVRKHLRQVHDFENWPLAVWLMTKSALVAEGDKLLAAHARKTQLPLVDVLRGELAFARGSADQALSSLQQIESVGFGWGGSYLASNTVADIWIRRGQGERAATVLGEAWNQRPELSTLPTMAFWMRAGAKLAALDHRLGRDEQARVVEAELFTLLAEADADFPLLQDIKRAQTAVALRRPPIAFQARDWVLVAQFENRTGDHALDGTIEYTLERELAESRFVNVAPRLRVDDSLRLMGKPVETHVDAAVGREVCVRDGGIKALISGRVDKLGSTYVLTADVRDPKQDVAVAAIREEAHGPNELWPAVRRVSNALRERLGESLAAIRDSDEQLEKVTTPSLRALRLYTESFQLGNRGNWPAALELAHQAVAADPGFASAQIWLAWALKNTHHPRDEYASVANRALELAASATEAERYWIRGSRAYMLNDAAGTEAAYGALLHVRPDHFWANSNMAVLYLHLGRPREAAIYAQKCIDLRPRATNPPFTEWRGWLALFPAFDQWIGGNPHAVSNRVEAVVATLPTRNADKYFVAREAYFFYLTLGRLKDAARVVQQLGGTPGFDSRDAAPYLAWISFADGDRVTTRQRLDGYLETNRARGPLTAMLAAQVGLVKETRSIVDLLDPMSEPGRRLVADAALARAIGQPDRAVSLFQDAIQQLRPTGEADYFFATESLADLYRQSNRVEAAVATLQDAAQERARTYPILGSSGMFWMRVEARLAEIYRSVGRAREAETIEAELLKLLADADADYPLLVDLKARGSAVAAPRH